jgi:hypothetical protein
MDDFSPIVERGTLEEAPGFLARIMRRRELPSVDVGSELVLVDQAGKPVAHGTQVSAGEKFWAGATSWIKVDIAEHTLELHIPFEDPGGRAGYVASLAVGARVSSSAKLAKSGASSVKESLAPALVEAVASCALTIKASSGSTPVDTLNRSRSTALATLRKSLRKNLVSLPDWLAVDVRSIALEFNAPTQRHYDDLVKHGREEEIAAATADVKRIKTKQAIDESKQWKDAVAELLGDPVTKPLAGALLEPTPESVKDAVDQMNAADALARERSYEVLVSLINNNYLHKTGELSDVMNEIRAGLRGGEGRDTTLSPPAKERQAIEAKADTAKHVDAQAETAEHRAADADDAEPT